MPGAGRSNSPGLRTLGVIAALVAVIGYLLFEWTFTPSSDPIPVALGLAGAVVAIAWVLLKRGNR